jgi:hypothetical protein
MSQGDQLVIAFTMSAHKVPADLSVRIAATPGTAVTDHDQPALTITATLRDTMPVSLEITAPTGSGSASAPQDHLHVVDNQLHIGIPNSLLVTVGPQWHWSASATSGAAHSQCPADAGSGDGDSAVVVS